MSLCLFFFLFAYFSFSILSLILSPPTVPITSFSEACPLRPLLLTPCSPNLESGFLGDPDFIYCTAPSPRLKNHSQFFKVALRSSEQIYRLTKKQSREVGCWFTGPIAYLPCANLNFHQHLCQPAGSGVCLGPQTGEAKTRGPVLKVVPGYRLRFQMRLQETGLKQNKTEKQQKAVLPLWGKNSKHPRKENDRILSLEPMPLWRIRYHFSIIYASKNEKSRWA